MQLKPAPETLAQKFLNFIYNPVGTEGQNVNTGGEVLGDISLAGGLIPFSTFARKSLDAEQGLTEFGKLGKKFVTLLGEHYGDIPATSEHILDHATRLSNVDKLNEYMFNPELLETAKKYKQFLTNRETLKSLDLPHPPLEFYEKGSSPRGQELFDSIKNTMESLAKSKPELAEEIESILGKAPDAYKKGKVLTFKPKE